ncbi:hypothetical protein FJY68_13775 [candidate division WOR-3 bacterium]|uniref:Uncharacterized protein n=1 Tax=candidate division WOR-3 bacterium TaxID=2052148 RepID=A0A938BUD1_UNCW3|nr:hypothetical protein [candidate division WOR-3 bacterium]
MVFFSDAADDPEGKWKALDVGWDNTAAASITKYVMVNLTAQLLYDTEIHDKLRLKETLALGLTYKFI